MFWQISLLHIAQLLGRVSSLWWSSKLWILFSKLSNWCLHFQHTCKGRRRLLNRSLFLDGSLFHASTTIRDALRLGMFDWHQWHTWLAVSASEVDRSCEYFLCTRLQDTPSNHSVQSRACACSVNQALLSTPLCSTLGTTLFLRIAAILLVFVQSSYDISGLKTYNTCAALPDARWSWIGSRISKPLPFLQAALPCQFLRIWCPRFLACWKKQVGLYKCWQTVSVELLSAIWMYSLDRAVVPGNSGKLVVPFHKWSHSTAVRCLVHIHGWEILATWFTFH